MNKNQQLALRRRLNNLSGYHGALGDLETASALQEASTEITRLMSLERQLTDLLDVEQLAHRRSIEEMRGVMAACSGPCRPPDVIEASGRGVCRICGKRSGAPFILNYGKEFAHEQCLKEQLPLSER